MANMNSNLYVFEGPDGVGKTTLSKMFCSYLNSIDQLCSYYSFPGNCSGTLGKHIYEIHHELSDVGIATINPTSLQMLHVASHIDAIESEILPALRSGQSILLDRFWWSTIVYGRVYGAKYESLQRMIEIEKMHWAEFQPDCVFYLKRQSTLKSSVAHWDELVGAYEKFVQQESATTRVEVIVNESSPENALKQIIEVCKSLEKKNHDQKTSA